ncbi:WXG100 family type VII secretion target [Nocardia sp. NPDC004278]
MVNFMGGGDVVALDHTQHKNVVKDMHDAINQIKNKIQEIEDSADRAKAGWKGDANASFLKAATEWHNEAETLKGRLNALSDAVDKGGHTITSMDQQT